MLKRLYRLLLMLYPREHRAEWGEHMMALFEDQLRDARREGRVPALLWRTLLDALRTIPREHLDTFPAEQPDPLPWWEVALAITPPITLIPYIMIDLSQTAVGLSYGVWAVFLLVLVGDGLRRRAFPQWGLAPLSLLLVFVLLRLSWHSIVFVLLLPLIGLLGLPIVLIRRRRTLSTAAVMVLAAALVASLIFSTLQMAAWQPLEWAMASNWLYSNVINFALLGLFPMMARLGELIGGRRGLPGAAFALGGVVLYTIFMDHSYGLWDSVWGDVIFVLPFLFAMVIAPVALNRARSWWGQALGFGIPAVLAYMVPEVLHRLVSDYARPFWPREVSLVLFPTLGVLLTVLMFTGSLGRERPADHGAVITGGVEGA
jgi:hypothetical protein